MDRLYIVMPAYNEAETLESVISEWHPVAQQINSEGDFCRILIADDGSTDATWEILSRCRERYPLLECTRKENSGHGPTVLHLYALCLERGADYIFQTDSDGQTIPSEFLPLWRSRGDFDVQTGSRPRRGDGLFRLVVSRGLRLSIKLVTGLDVKDANSPFRLYSASALARILPEVPSDFFLSNVAVSVIAVSKGFRIGWPEVSFRPRRGGTSMYNARKILGYGRQCFSDLVKLSRKI